MAAADGKRSAMQPSSAQGPSSRLMRAGAQRGMHCEGVVSCGDVLLGRPERTAAGSWLQVPRSPRGAPIGSPSSGAAKAASTAVPGRASQARRATAGAAVDMSWCGYKQTRAGERGHDLTRQDRSCRPMWVAERGLSRELYIKLELCQIRPIHIPGRRFVCEKAANAAEARCALELHEWNSSCCEHQAL